MTFLLKGTGVLYLILWLVLLIHWWKTKRFYPLFTTDRHNKIFWGITFLFFNPVLSVLYLIFAPRRNIEVFAPERLRRKRILAFVLCGLTILLMEIPYPQRNAISVRTDESEPAHNPFSAKATSSTAQFNTTTSTTKSGGNSSRLDIQHIAIFNNSDHPIMIKTAHRLQQALLELPMVEKVSYYPAGTAPENGQRLPELFVRIDMPKHKMIPHPGGRILIGTVTCNFSRERGKTNYRFSRNYEPPRSSFSIDIKMELKTSTIGFETSSARYADEVSKISEGILENSLSVLTTMASESGVMPHLPDYCYGPYTPAPPMPFETEGAAARKTEGYGLMSHNETTWIYPDVEVNSASLSNLLQRLELDGWKKSFMHHMTLNVKRGTEKLSINRVEQYHGLRLGIRGVQEDQKEDLPPPSMEAYYLNEFSEEEVTEMLEKLLSTEALPGNSVLMFGNMVRKSKSEPLKTRYREMVKDAVPSTSSQCLELSNYWNSQGKTDQAIELLKQASAYVWLMRDSDDLKKQIKKRAKEFKLEEDLLQAPSEETLLAAGILPIEALTNNLVKQVEFNQPFGFFTFTEGRPGKKKQLETLVFKLVHEPDPKKQGNNIQLVQMHKRKTMSSWSTPDGEFKNGLWHYRGFWSQFPGLPNGCVNLNVKQLDNKQYEFTFSTQ